MSVLIVIFHSLFLWSRINLNIDKRAFCVNEEKLNWILANLITVNYNYWFKMIYQYRAINIFSICMRIKVLTSIKLNHRLLQLDTISKNCDKFTISDESTVRVKKIDHSLRIIYLEVWTRCIIKIYLIVHKPNCNIETTGFQEWLVYKLIIAMLKNHFR